MNANPMQFIDAQNNCR